MDETKRQLRSTPLKVWSKHATIPRQYAIRTRPKYSQVYEGCHDLFVEYAKRSWTAVNLMS